VRARRDLAPDPPEKVTLGRDSISPIQADFRSPALWHHVVVKRVDGPAKSKKTAPAPKAVTKTATRATTKMATKVPAPKKFGTRADLGAPIDGFFAKQPPELRAILDELRKLVDEAAPDAVSAIKWGMPFYKVNGQMMCAMAGFKAHVNLILAGPPGSFGDLEGVLEGGGKTGRHLKLRALDELPRAKVRAWLRIAATIARKQPQRD